MLSVGCGAQVSAGQACQLLAEVAALGFTAAWFMNFVFPGRSCCLPGGRTHPGRVSVLLGPLDGH